MHSFGLSFQLACLAGRSKEQIPWRIIRVGVCVFRTVSLCLNGCKTPRLPKRPNGIIYVLISVFYVFCPVQVRRKVKSDDSPRIRPSDLRNFITMFVVFVLFAICWAPLNLIGLAVAIDPTRVAPRIPEWLFVVSYFMAYFNSCLNAVIYGLLNRNFRNEYKRIVTSVWVTRLFVTETSRAATEGRSMRSKQSPPPPLNNNESIRDRVNKEWILEFWACQMVIPVLMWYPDSCAAKE